MRTPIRYKAETKYTEAAEKKANTNIPMMAVVGDRTGGAVVVAVPNKANFYWIRLLGDDNRVTQCYSIIPLADSDVIYVAKAKDRKLGWYDFVTWVQDTGGGTAPPVQVHAFLGAAHTATTPAAPVVGDLITGQAGPVWASLAIGAANTWLNSDGTDATWQSIFDAVVPNVIQCDDAAATGAANVAARRDHEHGIVCAVAVNIANANAEGVATSFSRSDHVHNHPAGLGVNLHHNEVHVVNSTGPHAEAGLTIGHFLRATAVAAFSFAAILNADVPAALDVNPGTCTVATANVAATPHTHAITTSSNPGAAASILASSAAGALTLTGLLTVNAGVTMGGANGVNDLVIPDNLAIAFAIEDDGAAAPANVEYMRIVTTNAGPAQAVVFNAGEVDVDFSVRASAGISDPTDAFFVEGLTGRVFMGEVAPLYTGHVTIEDLAVNTTTEFSGLIVNHTKTGGVTDRLDDMFGLRSLIDINQGGTEVGWLYGAAITASVTNGTVGNAVTGARSAFGIYGLLSLGNASVVTLNAYGLYFGATQQAGGSIAGDFYAAYLRGNMLGTVTGTAYMLYLSEIAGIDYGIYQSGTAANQLGGKLTLTGAELEFTAASGSNLVEVIDNAADAWHLSDAGALEYIRINSQNANPYVLIDPAGAGIKVGIGTPTPLADLHVHTAGFSDVILGSERSTDGFGLGGFKFYGRNDAAEDIYYAGVLSIIVDASDGTEDGKLVFYTMRNTTITAAVEINELGHTYPVAAKAQDLGLATNEWDDIFYVTNNVGTSRLVRSTRICPVCATEMSRGTGTTIYRGETADYAVCFCLNCGNAAVEELNHLPPEKELEKLPPPKMILQDIRVKSAGRNRSIAVDFRYGDDVLDGTGEVVKQAVRNSTRLGEYEFDEFFAMNDKDRLDFLRALGEREWYSREETRLMREEAEPLKIAARSKVQSWLGKDLLKEASPPN